MIIKSSLLATPAASEWKKIGIRQHHGINVSLFSLHSKNSCGIGEFFDLLPLLDWCKKLGLDIIQLLPLNDTGNEPSPYSAISALALNPIHLSLSALPQLNKFPQLQTQIKALQDLTNTQRIDYKTLLPQRDKFLQDYFHAMSTSITQFSDYPEFLEKNPWLENYALFKTIKMLRDWQSWELWPEELRDPTPKTYNRLARNMIIKLLFTSLCNIFAFNNSRL